MFINSKLCAKGSRLRAFTLLEIILALAILSLLVGVLYSIVDATLHAASGLEEMQNQNRELTAFLALCRKTFNNMPASVIFEARVVPDGQNYSSELIFRNAPGLLWWGDAKNASLSTILGVRGQVGGLVGVAILQDSEDGINSYLNGGEPTRPWLVLLPDLRGAEWQFYDTGSSSWVKEWKNTMLRPACVKLTLTTPEGSRDYVFWMPPVARFQQQG